MVMKNHEVVMEKYFLKSAGTLLNHPSLFHNRPFCRSPVVVTTVMGPSHDGRNNSLVFKLPKQQVRGNKLMNTRREYISDSFGEDKPLLLTVY